MTSAYETALLSVSIRSPLTETRTATALAASRSILQFQEIFQTVADSHHVLLLVFLLFSFFAA